MQGRSTTTRSILVLLVLLLFCAAGSSFAATLDDRVELATEVMQTLLTESKPPAWLLDKTTCVAVLPRVV